MHIGIKSGMLRPSRKLQQDAHVYTTCNIQAYFCLPFWTYYYWAMKFEDFTTSNVGYKIALWPWYKKLETRCLNNLNVTTWFVQLRLVEIVPVFLWVSLLKFDVFSLSWHMLVILIAMIHNVAMVNPFVAIVHVASVEPVLNSH